MYPDFFPLELDGYDKYLSLWKNCPEKASDYSFINLYAWNAERGYEWAFNDGLCWLRTTSADKALWAPVGAWSHVDWRDLMEGSFPERAIFNRVPEKLALQLKRELQEKVKIEEDPSEDEYIYSIPELIELPGNKFHKKKNLLNQFLREYEYSYMEITPRIIHEILRVQKDWCLWKNCDGSPGLKAENEAIDRVLSSWEYLGGLFGGALVVEDRIVAYTIAEQVDPENVIIHFEKGLTLYKGVYQAINQLFLEKSCSSFKWVNREQDMGNEGLRKAKRSYNPIRMLKKFRVFWTP